MTYLTVVAPSNVASRAFLKGLGELRKSFTESESIDIASNVQLLDDRCTEERKSNCGL